MDRRRFLQGVTVALAGAMTGGEALSQTADWTYDGPQGPDHWGTLDPRNRVCAEGVLQSPIEIGPSIRAQLPPLKFTWAKRADTLAHNGRTLELNFRDGSRLDIANMRYALTQVFLRRPSEHVIEGRRFAMEAQFVHRHDSGEFAIVSVMIEPGGSNRSFRRLIEVMPSKEGPAAKADAGIDPNELLPKAQRYFRYSGSLTTPPCTETADWFILPDPIRVRAADIAAFAKLFPANARPARRDHRRYVLRSS